MDKGITGTNEMTSGAIRQAVVNNLAGADGGEESSDDVFVGALKSVSRVDFLEECRRVGVGFVTWHTEEAHSEVLFLGWCNGEFRRNVLWCRRVAGEGSDGAR